MKRINETAWLLAPLGLAAAFCAQGVVAGGMASIDRSFPAQPGGYLNLETTVTIVREPGFNGRTYWAHQWDFVGPQGGYVGLQQRSGTQKAINFSIWGATGWDAGNASCAFFDHEGDGVQCSAAFDWQEGLTYRIRVESRVPGRWTASITPVGSGERTVVATIHVPPDRAGIKGLSEWFEDFAQGSEQHERCEDVPRTIAVYGVPTMEGRPPSRSRARTYGNCARIARAICSAEQVCTLSGNPEPRADKPRSLRHVDSRLCLGLAPDGIATNLQACGQAGNQQLLGDGGYQLHLSGQSDRCLAAGADGRLEADDCFNSARQQWIPIGTSAAWFNPGSGRCLDSGDDALPGSAIRVQTCTRNTAQQWELVP